MEFQNGDETKFFELFMANLLSRNSRIEEDLIDFGSLAAATRSNSTAKKNGRLRTNLTKSGLCFQHISHTGDFL